MMSVTSLRGEQHLSMSRLRNREFPSRTKSLFKLPVIRVGAVRTLIVRLGTDLSVCKSCPGCEKYRMIASQILGISKLGELLRISSPNCSLKATAKVVALADCPEIQLNSVPGEMDGAIRSIEVHILPSHFCLGCFEFCL